MSRFSQAPETHYSAMNLFRLARICSDPLRVAMASNEDDDCRFPVSRAFECFRLTQAGCILVLSLSIIWLVSRSIRSSSWVIKVRLGQTSDAVSRLRWNCNAPPRDALFKIRANFCELVAVIQSKVHISIWQLDHVHQRLGLAFSRFPLH